MRSQRQLLVALHRWSGLTVGLALVFVATTGMALVFRDRLEGSPPAVLPACGGDGLTASRIASARALHAADMQELHVRRDGRLSEVRFRDGFRVAFEPCSGTVTRASSSDSEFFGLLEQLHRFKFLGDETLARRVAGSLALLVLFLFVGLGVTLWRPQRWRAVGASLRLRRGLTGRARAIHFHRTLGVYVSLVLMASAASALPIAFPWARQVIYAATWSAPEPALANNRALTTERQPLDETIVRLQSFLPAPLDMVLLAPLPDAAVLHAYVVEPTSPHGQARTMLHVDLHSGSVTVDRYADASRGQKVLRFLVALHMGGIGGFIGQLLLFAGMSGVLFLAYTGWRSFLLGRIARSRPISPSTARS